MRMDRTASFMAQDLLRKISERDLQALLKKYGEERWSKRIARRIIKERSVSGLKSTTQLARIITCCAIYETQNSSCNKGLSGVENSS